MAQELLVGESSISDTEHFSSMMQAEHDDGEWRYLVSQSEVHRVGYILKAENAKIVRSGAIKLGRDIVDNCRDGDDKSRAADRLSPKVFALLRDHGAKSYEIEKHATIRVGRKVVINLPQYRFELGGRYLGLGLSCTVCQGESHSKIWAKISSHRELEKKTSEILENAIDLVFKYYEEALSRFDSKSKLSTVHKFKISAAYSVDDELSDVINILTYNRINPIDEAVDRGVETTLDRLWTYYKSDDKFHRGISQLNEIWESKNEKKNKLYRRIVPLTNNEYDGVFVAKMDIRNGVTEARGLCHTFNLAPGQAPPVTDAANQLSGKLASLLAADI